MKLRERDGRRSGGTSGNLGRERDDPYPPPQKTPPLPPPPKKTLPFPPPPKKTLPPPPILAKKLKYIKKLSQATYRFDFGRVELPYESYSGGGAARLTYSVRASVKRPYGGSTAKEWGLAVRNARDEAPAGSEAGIGEKNPISSPTSTSSTSTPSTSTPPIKMEVGIEDCLHIEFEYEKASYHLSDVVLGRISFLLVRIRLKHMELEIRRRETSGSGSSARSEATTLAKYEIMDGAPVRGETVPIRLCLAPYDLTPTYLNVHNKVS